jgi:hypothetical protein
VRADRVLTGDDVGELECGIGPEVRVPHTRENRNRQWVGCC